MLAVQVKHLGFVNLPITVDVSFTGIDGAAAGRRIVPYTTHWQSKDFAYDEVGFDTAPLDAILNDTGAELTVDRIIGRFASLDNNGTFLAYLDYREDTPQSALYASIRVGLSQNRTIIRDFVPFLAAFGTEASIETAFKMAPQDYVTATVQHAAGDILLAPLIYFRGRAFLSIVGSREV